MKIYHNFTLTGAALIMLSASLALADDTLIVTLPGQTFTSGTGVTGTPTVQTVGTAFNIKLEAVTAGGTTVDTNFAGLVTVNYSGPTGGTAYITNVNFTSGLSTTTLATTLVDAQTTTISATATGAMTPVASSSLQVNPKLIVTLPGQTFTAGTGNGGTVSGQTVGVSFNMVSLTAINSDNTIDTAFTSAQTVAYSGPANAPDATAPTYTTAVTFASGQSTTALATTLVDEQTTTITAGISGLAPGVASSSVTVTAANSSATKLAFTMQPNGGQGGAAWTIQPVVAVEDVHGNIVLGTNQNVTLAIQNNPASGTMSGTVTMSVATNTGLATFTGLSINNTGQGYTLTATGATIDTSAGTIVSKPFNIITLTCYDSLVLGDGAYGYWPLQETTGPVFFDIAGTNNGLMYTSTDAGAAGDTHSAFIVAGANQTDGGTYYLGAPGPLAGFPGDKAVYFTNLNGALSNSDIVISVYNAALDHHIFTAEAWINIPTFPIGYTNQSSQVPLGFEDNAGNQAGWYIGVYADKVGGSGSTAYGDIFFNLAHNTHNGFTSVNANSTPGGAWYYVAEVYDGTNLYAYTNGIQLYKAAATYDDITDYGGHLLPMVIGSYCESYFPGAGGGDATGDARDCFWNGGISHVAFYHTALSVGQILTHYNTVVGPPPTPLIVALQPIGLTNYVGYSPTLLASIVGIGGGGCGNDSGGVAYQWYQNTIPLPGQTNQTLTLNNLVASNAGTYYLSATNSEGSTNSANAVVVVLPLPSDPYQSNVISTLPVAYYPMHETGPAVSDVTPCVDLISYDGAQDGALYVAADNVTVPTLGVAGPGGSSDLGTGVILNGAIPNGAVVTNPVAMSFITGNSTMEAWIQVNDYADAQNIIMHGPSVEGNPSKTSDYLGFDGFGDYYVGKYQQNSGTNYTYAFYGPNSPVTPTPTAPASDAGNWVHLVGTSDGAAWHLYRNAQEVANWPDTNGAIDANGGWAFGARNNMATPPNNVIIPDCIPGASPSFGTNGTGLTATINNVALYNYALTPGQILAHYQIGATGHTSPVTNILTITSSNPNATLTWNYGTLQEAASVNGPWTDDLAVSPYTVGETNAARYYRAVIK